MVRLWLEPVLDFKSTDLSININFHTELNHKQHRTTRLQARTMLVDLLMLLLELNCPQLK